MKPALTSREATARRVAGAAAGEQPLLAGARGSLSASTKTILANPKNRIINLKKKKKVARMAGGVNLLRKCDSIL